jgi:hypothetical protein
MIILRKRVCTTAGYDIFPGRLCFKAAFVLGIEETGIAVALRLQEPRVEPLG